MNVALWVKKVIAFMRIKTSYFPEDHMGFRGTRKKEIKPEETERERDIVALRHYVSFCYWTKKIYRCPNKNPSTNK
jgi:hypothetical protein